MSSGKRDAEFYVRQHGVPLSMIGQLTGVEALRHARELTAGKGLSRGPEA